MQTNICIFVHTGFELGHLKLNKDLNLNLKLQLWSGYSAEYSTPEKLLYYLQKPGGTDHVLAELNNYIIKLNIEEKVKPKVAKQIELNSPVTA